MKIYDISQEVLSCVVFPGDPAPYKEQVKKMDDGELYNLSMLHMCAHNGTHVDAPYHFINQGRAVEAIELERFVGMAYVAEYEGVVTAEDANNILMRAKTVDAEAGKRILIKGNAVISLEAAEVFADEGILLVGNESQTVGPENAPMEVHKVLLEVNVVLLEGIRLAEVTEGAYLLNAAPLNIAGADGAPCRAILIALER